MGKAAVRIIGIVLIIAAIAGIIITIGGIVAVWQVRSNLTTSLTNTFSLLETTLNATSNALKVADDSITQAAQAVNTLASTVQISSKSVNDSIPMLDGFTTILTKDLPNTIQTTQGALSAAQSSATVIDSTLRLLTAIPLFSGAYEPAVPLGDSLGEVAASLDPLPKSLTSMEDSLNSTKGNLTMMAAQIATMGDQISSLSTSLIAAKGVINQYLGVVSQLQQTVSNGKANLPNMINMMAWVLTIVLAWLAITQVGLLMQGLEMIGVEVEADEMG